MTSFRHAVTGKIGSLRKVRVFTAVDSRKATPEEVHIFTSEAEMAQLKGAGEIDEKAIMKFPTVEKMASTPGKKDGDITVFREGKIV
jgi:hypothetical protein